MFLITLVTPRWLQRPVLAFLLILGAVSSYYQDTLGTTIDRDMVQNALTTTMTESKHLINAPFLIHLLVFGILPALVVAAVPVRRAGLVRAAAGWGVAVGFYLALTAASLYANAKTLMAAGREHQEVVTALQPFSPVRATYEYSKMMMRKPTVVAPFGRDATPGPLLAAADRPVLMLLWVGETARAEDWGLNGYERDTTPALRARNVVNFSDATSCGTATAVSMPCMFSHLRRTEYSYDAGLSSENLLDVLAHAGFAVEWWDNNTGDKDIAKRQSARFVSDRATPEFCGRGECIDGVFFDLIREKAQTITTNTVLVLHKIGSHGPSYHLRYPVDAGTFAPACATSEVATCTLDELRNAYDNTLLYSDKVIATSIDILDGVDRVIPMVFYASDHGESLGENGLYLHGAPWFMAPVQQIKVPMMLWMSDRYQTALGVSMACLREKAGQPLSHDNMFSSILGLADIKTSVIDPDLDLTAGCRGQGS
jgi:lipid A ethanolaminephosphotransferase